MTRINLRGGGRPRRLPLSLSVRAVQVQCCFLKINTSTETILTVTQCIRDPAGAQDRGGHLNFHTEPELRTQITDILSSNAALIIIIIIIIIMNT